MTEVIVQETLAEPIQIVEETPEGETVIREVEAEVSQVELLVQGPVGPAGPEGPEGPEGGKYSFEQDDPATTWTVTHNLGRYPIVGNIIESTGAAVGAEIIHDSVNQFRVLFDGASTGRVPYS